MQVKVDGKRNITLDFEAPKKFKLLQDGKEIPYLRTGKNSFRLSRNIDGVLDLEEIIEQPKIVKPMQLQAQQMALVNPNDVLIINQAAQQLEVEQNILGETQKRVEQTQAYLDVQQQRINETILSVEGLETNNAKRITATENGLFNLAGNLAKTEQNLIDGIEIVNNSLQEHKNAKNPHGITKKTIGLDKVDNTSDMDKPISKAVQNALDEKADKDEIQAIRDELGEYQEKNDRFTNALSNYTGGLAGNQIPDGGSTGQILAKRTDMSGDVEWINSSASITIDDELSLTSKNPVQNKVITNKINSEVASLTTRVGNLETGKQDKLTQIQLDAVNSGANTTNIGQINTNTSDIADINALIPNQATTLNQLADKGFVNSSIATNTAYFIGTFNSVAELEAYSGTLTNNDYAFVATTDTAGNTLYDRYKWNGSQWLFEYELNNSSFTASQWASINSNATAEKIAKISTNETTINNHIANTSNPHSVTKAQVGLGNVDNTSDLSKPISTATQTALNGKQATLVSGTDIKTINNVSVLGSGDITVGVGYGTSSTAAATVQKEVSIPSITTLNVGQIIAVQPTATSTVANSTLKLNNFDAYPMRYNNAEITTSTDSIVWNASFPSQFVFDGDYWVFLGHGVDTNTTYTINYSIDAGNYTAGVGTYAVTRYSLLMEKPDGTWEKITDTTKTHSTAITKTVNTRGFWLNHIRYYNTTTVVANGALIATNTLQNKAASVTLAYSTNCGTAPNWAVGDYIYLVGTIGADGYFYLDTTQWWSNSLPNTNDGKLYIRLGVALTTTDSKISFFDDRPIYYHDGISIKEYKVADNKQDTISDLATIRSGASAGATAVQPSDLATVATTGDYGDLLNKPTIPAAQIQSDWTQADNTKLDYIKNKPTIPTVNNATLTIQKNGTNVATFTANASSNVTANIGVPNTVSSVSSSSTNDDAVGAKLFYDTCGDIETLINAL